MHPEQPIEKAPPWGGAAEPDRLGGYRLVREIGRGGMGVVYEAVEESLGRHVALKMLPAHTQHQPGQLSRFRREARAAGRLIHRHIVPVYGVGEHGGVHYYVMQYIAGHGLDRVLADLRRQAHGESPVPAPAEADRSPSATVWGHGRGTPNLVRRRPAPIAPPVRRVEVDTTVVGSPASRRALWRGAPGGYFEQVARVGVQVAEALAYAHGQGILHRDIKPSNLLLDDEGNAWITDFGLAKALDGGDDLSQGSDVLGTLRFMAPERFSGHSDPRSDVYSLGLTLYELLTLRPAFTEADRNQLVHQVLQHARPSPRAACPDVPRDLDTIVGKAIAREPERRYAGAAELADDLRRWLEDRPIQARPAGRLEHAWRWCRRNPAVATLLAALFSVLVLSIALVSWKWLDEAQARQAAQEAAGLAQGEQARAEEARRQAERLSAHTGLDLGISLGDRGQSERAVVLMAQGLELAVRSGDTDLERALRINLAAWRGQLFRQRAQVAFRTWVCALAYSPDGQRLLAGSRDGTAVLCNVATGEPVGPRLRHETPIWAVAFRPDGQVIATGGGVPKGRKGEIRLWDRSGRPLRPPLAQDGAVSHLSFDRDGHSLLAVVGERVLCWKTTDPLPSAPAFVLQPPEGVLSAAVSPDGRFLVTGGANGTARLWEADTGRPLGQLLRHASSDRQTPGEDCLVTAAAFSSDGQLVVTATRVGIGLLVDGPGRQWIGGEARIWRVPTGEPVGEPVPQPGPVWDVAFSPDGRRVLAGGMHYTGGPRPWPGEARQWHVATGRLVGAPLVQSMTIWAVAYSPDGRILLTGSENGQAQFWNAATGLPLGPARYGEGNALAATFAPDGKTAVIGHATGPGTFQLWEVPRGLGTALPPLHSKDVLALAYRADGRLLLSGSADGTARLWDGTTGRPMGTPFRHRGPVLAVAFSPDGRLALTGSADHTARLWEVDSGRPFGPPLRHGNRVTAVAFSPDGRLVLTGSDDRTAQLWDVSTGLPHGPPIGRNHAVRTLVFSPDGRWVAATDGEWRLRLWDVATGKPSGRLLDHGAAIGSVAFSPDGRWLLTGGDDGTARVWDLVKGTRHGPTLRHSGGVSVVAFSPDGRCMLTGSHDCTAWLWDSATGQPLTSPQQHPGAVTGAVFRSDGRVVATRCADGSVRIWDVATGHRLGPAFPQPGTVTALAFQPGGMRLAVACSDGLVRLWELPGPVQGDATAVRCAAEAVTGVEATDQGAVRELKPETLRLRRRDFVRHPDPFEPLPNKP